jgi:hypothetical protein
MNSQHNNTSLGNMPQVKKCDPHDKLILVKKGISRKHFRKMDYQALGRVSV